MRRVLAAALAVLSLTCVSARGAPDQPSQTQTPDQTKKTPKDRFQAVLDEYQNAQAAFSQVYSKAKTDVERSRIVNEKYPKPTKYAARFMAMADMAPDDPVAVSALTWCLQLGSGSEATKAMRRLAEKHAADPKLGSAIPSLAYSFSPAAETLLRSVI